MACQYLLGDALLPLLFNFALEFSIRLFQANQVGIKLNEVSKLLVSAEVNLLCEKNIEMSRNKDKI